MGDIATLSIPVAPGAASTQLEIMDPVYDRKNSQLVTRVRIAGGDWIMVTVAIGAAAKTSLDTAIAAAIKAKLAGNPDVVLP